MRIGVEYVIGTDRGHALETTVIVRVDDGVYTVVAERSVECPAWLPNLDSFEVVSELPAWALLQGSEES